MAVKARVRELLGAPFRITNDPAKVTTDYKLLARHFPVLRTPSLPGFEKGMELMRSKQWELRKFIFTASGTLFLDTDLGWTITGRELIGNANWGLVEQSQFAPKPNLLKWLVRRRRARGLREVIWIPFGQGNYWHFFDDLLAGIYLLRGRVDLERLPILITRDLAQAPFFNELVGYSSLLSRLKWEICEPGEWIRCSSLHTAGTFFGSYSTFADAASLLDKMPQIVSRPQGKLFISRSLDAVRGVANIQEVNDFFKSQGFRVVLLENMTVREQWETINLASYVVAIHGAGMANLAFHARPDKLSVLEITPENYINPCYAYMAEEAGISYYCLTGGALDPSLGTFRISTDLISGYLARVSKDPMIAFPRSRRA